MTTPPRPKIYHIVHVDRLASIITDGHLWCDAEAIRRNSAGTTIGMAGIKLRRLRELTLRSHPGLHVGDCVPFYFCPRSVMLYLLHRGNHEELTYRGGQAPIVHLEADLLATVDAANRAGLRWAFTLSNAGSRYFEDRADLRHLEDLDWAAISATSWATCKEQKQAEFLVESRFPWALVERIGVCGNAAYRAVVAALPNQGHRPVVEIRRDWYY